jgi:hypothetical protein
MPNTLPHFYVEISYVCATGGAGSRRIWLDELQAWMDDRRAQGEPVLIVNIRPM